jgi:hypothetical protein
MKTKLAFLLFSLVFLTYSCGKDDTTPSNDSGDDGNDPPVPEEPLLSADIDENGGVLEWNTLVIDIPEGSFQGTHTVEVSELTGGANFGSDEASVFYSIDGIPYLFSEPLTLSIDLENKSDDGIFMVIGEDVSAPSLNGQQPFFRFEEGVIADGKYSFTLEVVDDPGNATDESLTLHVGLVKNYMKVSSKGNFEVYAPSSMSVAANHIANSLEEAHTLISMQRLGFSYGNRTKWPIKAHLKEMADNVYGYFVPSKFGDNYSFLEFNSNKAAELDEMKITVGHEFFHLVQALYDPRWGFIKATSPSYYYWLQEAASVWIEERFSEEENYVSSIRYGHQMAPFKGMIKGGNENPQEHGYGMAALIKYIEMNYGEDKLVEMFTYGAQGNNDILGAFNESLPNPLSSFYPDFIDQYIQGNIYDDMGIANLLSSVDGTFTINAEDDTLKKFESNYPGLSAKVYKIEPKYSNFQDGSKLTLKTSHGTKKIIYKLKGNDLTFLGSAIGYYEVPGLKQLQQENAVVIVVVVHQYYTDMEEELEAVVNHSQPEIFWETCSANFYDVHMVYLRENLPDGNSVTYENTSSQSYSNNGYTGSFEGGVFNMEWDYVEGYTHKTGRAEFHVNLSTNMLTYGEFEWEGRSTGNYPDENYDIVRFKVANIEARFPVSPYVAVFELNGSEFCDNATFYDFYKVNSSGIPTSYMRYTLQDYSCLAETRFTIILNKSGY